MRTVNKVGGVNGLSYTEFYGNSTDVKPTDDTVPNGSVFYEIDNNMQEYRWDKENGEWKKIESSGGGGGGGDYLPLSGGKMSGDIDMDANSIDKVKDISLSLAIDDWNSETEESTISYDNSQKLIINYLCYETDGEPDGEENALYISPYREGDNLKDPPPVVIFPISTPSGTGDYVAANVGYVSDYVSNNAISLNGNSFDNPITGEVVLKVNQDSHYQTVGGLKIYAKDNNLTGLTVASLDETAEISKYYNKIQISPTRLQFFPFLDTNYHYRYGENGYITLSYNPKATNYERLSILNFKSVHLQGGGYANSDMPITIGTPVEDNEATTKKYVDDLVATTLLSGDNTDKTLRLKSGNISTELTYADLHIANTTNNKSSTLTEQLLSFTDTTTTAPYNIRLYPTVSNSKPSLQIFNQNGSTNENVVLKNIETPIEDNDAVNKAYVDGKMVSTYVSTKTFTTSTKVPASSEKFIFYTITSVAKTHKLVSATICFTGGSINSYELLLTCYLDTVTDSNGNYTINAYAHNLGSNEIDLNGASIQCTVAYMD